MRKFYLGGKSAFAFIGGFIIFIGCAMKPPEMTSNVASWVRLLCDGHCPGWLADKNADRIGQIVGLAVITYGAFLFLKPLWTGPHPKHFKRIEDILKKMRSRVPQDGNWTPLISKNNYRLAKIVVGHEAIVHLTVLNSKVTDMGRYQGIPRIEAKMPDDSRTGLVILLYAYFDKAIPEEAKKVLSFIYHDSVCVRGRITRADITYNTGDKRFCFNIDLSDCEIIPR